MEEVMKIDQCEPDNKINNLVVKVVNKLEEQKTQTGKRVCEFIVEDDTGQIKLKLWEENIDNIEIGQKILIKGGFCGKFQDQLYITIGKFGKLLKVPPINPK